MNSLHTRENPAHYLFETVPCYQCGEAKSSDLLIGQDDLTGKPGNFSFVTCLSCGLVYQNPRIDPSQIRDFYDDEYIAHRKKKDWGILTPLYERAMSKHDRDKVKIVSTYLKLDTRSSVLDVGCAVGSFLQQLKRDFGCQISGVDFKNFQDAPGFDQIDFYHGLFYEQEFSQTYDLITMWHFLEHCYDPVASLKQAHDILKSDGFLIIEVPCLDSVSYRLFRNRWPGVQAPQHTVLFDKRNLIKIVTDSGWKVIDYLPYGAFPPYFYLFTGVAFTMLKGKGLNLDKMIIPYFVGQLLLLPLLFLASKRNLAMQTVVCCKE